MRRLCFTLLICLFCAGVTSQDIFDKPVIEIHIDFARDDWRTELHDRREREERRRIPATVRIDDVEYRNVRIRYKGNSSFFGAMRAGYKKLPFNLRARGNAPFDGQYPSIKLSNNYRDPSAIRELLAYRIAGHYIPVPRTAPAAVYVNGDYKGVYTATEGIDTPMLRRYFGNYEGILIKCEPDFHADTPQGCPRGAYASLDYLGENIDCYENLYDFDDDASALALIRLTRYLQDSIPDIEEVLDVHHTLWKHAINMALMNLDSYLGLFCHNYYLYQDSFGIFHPLIWDLNLAFGAFRTLAVQVEPDLPTLSPLAHSKYALKNRPLISQLLNETRYRRLYLSMLRTITDEWLVNGRWLEEAQALQAVIRPWIEKEEQTFFALEDFDRNLYTTVTQEDLRSIPGIAELVEARTAYLDAHPLLRIEGRAVESWSLKQEGEKRILEVLTNADVRSVKVYYGAGALALFTNIEMERKAGQDGVFSCILPENTSSFHAELTDARSVQLWPRNAPGRAIAISD